MGIPVNAPHDYIDTLASAVATPPAGYVSQFSEGGKMKQKDSAGFVGAFATLAGVEVLDNKTLNTPVINGIPSGSGVSSNNSGNTLMLRNIYGYSMANNNITLAGPTATAGGITTISSGSYGKQIFTGTLNETVRLPAGNQLYQGTEYEIINTSTGIITVQTASGVFLMNIPSGSSALFTSIFASDLATSWSIKKEPGVAASVVATRIRRSTNQSIATGTTYIDLSFDTSAYQSNGAFWTSGATVTIPETGYYQGTIDNTFEGAAVAVTCNMQVLVNGTLVISEDEKMTAAGALTSLSGSFQRFFTAGDTLKVQVKHSSATALNILTQGDHSPDIYLAKLNGAKGDPGTSGITRSVSSIAINTTGGATANTDYVYLCTATLTYTLPTAVGNTNTYTVKNVGGITTIATTASQTIDGSANATLSVQYTSLNLISDGTNWNII